MLNNTNHQGNANLLSVINLKTSYLSEWLPSKRQEITSVGKNVGKREPMCTVDANANWCSHYRKQYGHFSKQLKIDLLYHPAIPLLGIFLQETKTLIFKKKYIYIYIYLYIYNAHCSIIYNSKIWKQPKCPLIDDWIKKMWCICIIEYYSAIKRRKSCHL